MASSSITSWLIAQPEVEAVTDFILFSWAPISLQMVIAATKLKDPCSLKEAMTNLDSVLKSRDITFLTKVKVKSFSLVWLFVTP